MSNLTDTRVWVDGGISAANEGFRFEKMHHDLNVVQFSEEEEWCTISTDTGRYLIHNKCPNREVYSRPTCFQDPENCNWYCDVCGTKAAEEADFLADLAQCQKGERWRRAQREKRDPPDQAAGGWITPDAAFTIRLAEFMKRKWA